MMTETKTTNAQNIEEQERLKQKYEEENQAQQQKILDLENKITKKNDEIFELQKESKRVATERDDWKKECHAVRKVQSETKEAKEQADFKSEFIKLQQKKRGLTWDEARGWVSMK